MADRATPQWTVPLREQTSGLDHLGLGSVGNQQVLVRLLPDIYVQTVHPGYLSFYAFVLDEFWRRDDLPRTRASWRRFYRSTEVVFSVAANMCEHPDYDGDFGSIVGSNRTRELAGDPPTGGIDTGLDYMKSAFGGYGLYYRSPMVAMGLVYPAPENGQPVDLPTERGQELAEAFRERIAKTVYRKRHFRAERVPAGAVAGYGEVACPCRLRDGAPDLDAVRDVYLHGGPPATSAARRASLRMVLDLADQTDGTALDQPSFRQLLYFGRCEDGAEWNPRSDLEEPQGQLGIVDTWRRWRLYQAREFYAFGLDGLWRWLVDWGLDNEGDLRPIAISDAITALRQSIDGAALGEALDIRLPSFGPQAKVGASIRRLLRSAGEPEIAPSDDPSWPDRRFDVSADLTEWSLYRVTNRGAAEPAVVISACLAVMMLVGARFDLPQLRMREDWTFAQFGGLQRLSLNGFISGLRHRIDEGATIGDLAEWLVRDYVISQHLRVAAAKLPFNTYRFVREGDRLRFFDRTRPIGMNSARFEALSYTMSGIGFVEPLTFDDHPLTDAGSELLERGDWSVKP
jgi:hypothetical protein